MQLSAMGLHKYKVFQEIAKDLIMLKDKISRNGRDIPADMLLSAAVNTVHRMQSQTRRPH